MKDSCGWTSEQLWEKGAGFLKSKDVIQETVFASKSSILVLMAVFAAGKYRGPGIDLPCSGGNLVISNSPPGDEEDFTSCCRCVVKILPTV